MKILIVSHNFPKNKKDIHGIHGKRCAGIYWYLKEEGFDVTLLTGVKMESIDIETLMNFDVDFKKYHSSKSLDLKKWGYKTKILILIDLLKLNNLLFFPDMCFTWIRKAVKKGSKIIETDKPDLIYAIMNPYSSFVVAYKLAKKYTIPLVLDYSDPYSCHPFNPIKNRFVRNRQLKLEKKIFDYSVLQINVVKECADITTNCLNKEQNTFKIIHTGFFEELIPKRKIPKKEYPFIISYFGSFYGLLSSAFHNFTTALRDYICFSDSFSYLRFQYAGGTSRKIIRRAISNNQLEHHFEDLGIISQERCYLETQKGHVSLFFCPLGTEYTLPTKVFDYVANNTHVLIIGEECATTRFFDEIEQEYTLVANRPSDIGEALYDLFVEKWMRKGLSYGCNKEKLLQYSRKNQTKKLSKILKDLIKK